MSQSGSGGLSDAQGQTQAGQTTDSQQTTCQNGRVEPLADTSKQDITNGFENRTLDYERFTQERTQHTLVGQVQDQQLVSHQQQQQQQIAHPIAQYPGRKQTIGLPEDKHPSTGQLPQLQYGPDKNNADRTHVSQTSTQTVPVQVQPQFAPDYDQNQYPQIRGQFEVRSQIYPQTQYSDRAGYVTRDVTYRDPNLYGQSGTTNPIFTGQGQYVTVQHGSQIPSQSASPQPPYYSGVVVPSAGYAQFGSQPQYPYSQYPQTVMNAVPYNPHPSIYPAQQYPSQQSPNPQRFSQEIGQYQTQPIIQPIAQNVTHGIAIQTERPCRGPKPMVPPRGNSKITTHDPGHRKSASVDVPAVQKAKYEPNPTAQQDSVHRSDGAIIMTNAAVGPDGPERRYLASINQNPRTRQDGLYVDTNGEQTGREKLVDAIANECGLYVSRSEHRKSISVDVTTSFQRRNDTITFTFPGDGNQEIMSGRKPTTVVDTKRLETNQMFPAEQRRLDTSLRVSPMAFDTRQENRKSIATDRKPEWGNVSPNQRNVIPPENRRSDYFEEHRRSPMNLEGKRMEDVRRSPMPFVPIRDTSIDRAGQKSPSFLSQNFEKTRQELAIWAEQRQRQEHERNIQGPIFTTSPRSRNPSEERRDVRPIHPSDDRKESRMSQSAFQPLPNISQSTIMEQRRHLRHVSADLTKHMELSRKDFDEQPITGSVVNLGSGVSAASSQRASPNLCHQYPALSEAKLDTKTVLTVVTDFGETNTTSKPIDQIDHIIHSHRKSHNISSNLLTHSKSQTENLQNTLENQVEKIDSLNAQQQQLQNQQSLDLISEKLSQFERQQSDLQARLQCLQNQNQILDKVAQFQNQQSDFQARLQSLQNQSQLNDKTHKISSDFAQLPLASDNHQASSLSNHQEQSSDKSCSAHPHGLHQTLLTTYPQNATLQACQSSACEKLTSRVQHDISDPNSIQIPNMSQMPLPCLPQFDRADVSRTSFSQFHRLQCQIESHESASATSASLPASSFTGTLKKIPPEKPPRTSLIVQSPEAESNRSQPAIGLKQTPKARPTIFGTVASDLTPKDGNSRKSLPQTPAGGAGGKASGSAGSSAGMVNGADHESIRDGAGIDTELALVYRDGNLVSGSLEALVQHMVPTEEYYPDRAYLFAFLLSARLFIKPHELLGEVCALCEHQQNLNGEGGKERLHRFVPRLVQLLAEWTETFPYDFRDERVMGHVRSITQKVAAVDAAARQEVSALLQNLLVRLTALERYEEGLARLATEAATEQLTQVDITELCPSATVLAQQLTHVELERLSYIGPEEFVQAFAKESPHLETSFKDMKKTRNLESYVQWFNRLSYFVATEVCKHQKKKQRVRVVEYWIETARECFNIGNFNSLMAIIAGLNMSPISRLKKTWSKVQSAKFSILEHQMDPSSNFSSYRSTLKAAMWRSAGATDERQRIVVPFFSLLVKDLYFLNEGCSNKLPNGHINFEKFWQLAKQVTEFIAWKQVACPFEKNPRVIAFLQASPVLTENALALASFDCEPPDNNPEKERYKALKSENAQ
ncbi:uncharacterized protein LOC105832483 [Monomorium pharaonis]|uniref:uncharacterized protein LOC105832483 n=1 Tax=Monomorium pharaonis TaxID=307658 RepID=UPI00102E14ED|nr:uncharacterized protein LOC105832483 [Monomorium pharaonis]XP_028049981.1 uncharacterized protein LOC105832483 [Monomorium pharaonis]XP_028049982.1 uncharacterized protein LOC105832483 [Monomorium pharaonis]